MSPAVRRGALLVAAVLLVGGTAGCGGVRDRVTVPGPDDPAAAAATPAQEQPATDDVSPGGGGDTATAAPATSRTTTAPAVSEAQVRAVEGAVGAASKVVSQGEAEVASDG